MTLDSDEARHVLHHHYTYANRSTCQFTDLAKVSYVTDLLFEIDAHAGPHVWMRDVRYYAPAIGAAVLVGRRIYDYLVGPLRVDPTYITTSITRMGARVTVDWRAFGPISVAQAMSLVRFVEGKVFGESEMAQLSERLRRAMEIQTRRLLRSCQRVLGEDPGVVHPVEASVRIDGGIYGVSDWATRDRERSRQFKGPLCRPPGALHPLSGLAAMWCRITPVPHERFFARYARWLTSVSRSDRGPDIDSFPEPLLFSHPWPETRRAESNLAIEGNRHSPRLPPSQSLVALAANWRSLEVPEKYRADLARQEHRRRSVMLAADSVDEVTPDVVENIVQALGLSRVGRRRDRLLITCPYCHEDGCAVVYLESGAFHCPRSKCDAGSKHITQVALDFGLGSLVPFRRASSQVLRYRSVSELRTQAQTWEEIASVRRVVSPTVVEARRWLTRVLDEMLPDDTWRVLIVQGPTGVGKTTVVLDALRRHGLTIRAAFPRDDNRHALPDAYEPKMPTKIIDGRRATNCTEFDRVSMLQSRGLPARLVCNAGCPSRQACNYLAQFGDVQGVSLALNHAHLHFLDLKLLDNGSDVVLIDENPLNAAVQTIDLDQSEVARFRIGWDVRGDELLEDVTFDDVTVLRTGVTPRIESLICWLEAALTNDAISLCPPAAKRDAVGDLALATHWFWDGKLSAILQGVTEADLEQHEAEVYSAAERHLEDPQRSPKPPRGVLRDLVEGLRDLQTIYERRSVRPSSLFIVRNGNSWGLRLTQHRNLMHGRTIILSSTMTPTQFLLAFGQVPGLRVIQPEVAEREKRVLVPDRQFGTTRLLGSKPTERELRGHLFETVRSLVKQERERTGMPVALLGRAETVNTYLEELLGERLPPRLRMPFRTERAERAAELRLLTEPLGLLCGYALGVAGSNNFAVNGRFVRSCIVVGGILPPLGDVEARWRGSYAAYPFFEVEPEFGIQIPVDRIVDWTQVARTVPIPGTELGEGDDQVVAVASNVFGFADPLPNELLRHSYEDELVQMVGRMRGCIADRDGIEARAYVISHIAVPGWPVDEVITLDELRERVGLAPLGHHRAGRPALHGAEALARRIKSRGRQKTIVWMVERFLSSGAQFDPRMPRWRGCVSAVDAKLAEAGQRGMSEDEWRLARAAAEAALGMDRKIS